MLIAAAGCSFAATGKIIGVLGAPLFGRLTGTPSINNTTYTYDIGGQDLGFTINHNGKTYFLFGDTFSGEDSYAGGHWRNNTVAWTSDTTPANGIMFETYAMDGNGAKETFDNNSPSGSGVISTIPTGGLSVNGSMYVWFMNVKQWGPASGEWYASQAELGKWNDTTKSFSLVSNSVFAGNGNFGMVAAREGVNGDPYIYLWGTPAGRFGGVKLARFLPSQIESRSSYQFYDGTLNGVPQWTSNEFSADIIVPAPAGEMSVMYNQAVGAWTMLYSGATGHEMRQSDTPWGPWSAPVTILTESQGPSGTFGIYAPYMNPLWVEGNGQTIYYTMSLWVPYDVYLAKAVLNIVPTAPTGTVQINGTAQYTNSKSVVLTTSAGSYVSAVTQMRISNDGVFDTETWQSYSSSASWTLTTGDGTKTVYVRYKDALGVESDTVTDTIILSTLPPTISSATLTPTMVLPGDGVHVTVNATDPTGLTSVKANGVSLTQTDSTTWQGNVTALTILGSHPITAVATNAAGNRATKPTTGYTTAQVYGATAASLSHPITTAAAANWLFRVWGKATIVDANTLDLADGSGTIVRVTAPGYSGIAAGDYASATGILTPGANPSLAAQAAHVNKLSN